MVTYINLMWLNVQMEQVLVIVHQKAGNYMNGLLEVAEAHDSNAGGRCHCK